MISKIKKDLEQLLTNYNIVNLYNKNHIKRQVNNYLYANYNNYDYNVVCDNSNNTPNSEFTSVDVYIKDNRPIYTNLKITILKDSKKELREKRKRKLRKLKILMIENILNY
jgi:hypothetical protein